MIVDMISDLHGHYPELEGGDLLIVAGDLTARDLPIEHINFYEWCKEQLYRKIIIIAGNHDNFIQNLKSKYFPPTGYYDHCEYLCDSGTEFEYEEDNIELEECGMHPTEEKKVKIWGSPWTKTFPGMNPKCKAFTCDTEEELASKFSLIPDDIDILITHSPPYGIFDYVDSKKGYVGSKTLREHVICRIKPRIHIYGHIHEDGGRKSDMIVTQFINASHVNEHYQPVNKPVRIIL